MRYKLEIIADSMSELVTKTRVTFMDLADHKSADFVASIESKGMTSIFFTRHANIHVVGDEVEPCNECGGSGYTGILDCPECGTEGVTRSQP